MEDIGEITELCNDDGQVMRKRETTKDDIEIGLEIVALEMGNILEELKDNLERLSWTKNTEEAKNKEAEKTRNKNAESTANKEDTTEKENNLKSEKLHRENKRNFIPAINADKFQQTPNINNKIKKISSDKSKMKAQKINNKPNYQVQKTNRTNCDKLINLNHLTSSSYSQKTASYCNKINTMQPTCSHKLVGNIQIKQPTPVITVCKRSSGSSTPSTSTTRPQHSTRRIPHYSSRQILRRQSSLCSKDSTMSEPLKTLREQVEKAMRERKTFTVCGNYYTIRRALLSRGWIEKIRILYNTYDRDNLRKLQSTNIQELLRSIDDPQNGYIYKRIITSKLLGQHQVDFYWDQNYDCFRICRDNIKVTLVNRFRRGIFSYSSKPGLCESMKRSYWFQFPGVSNVNHPRSYNLSNTQDPKDFINDFKLTAAMSLLKWIVRNQENRRNDSIISSIGRIPLKIYHFAVAELSKALRKCQHEDIDYEIEETFDYEWNEFLENFYKIVHIGNRFKNEGKETVHTLIQDAKNMLMKIEKFWPHLGMDGMMNIWILKPTNGSRGEGIYLCRTLQYILKIIKSNTTRRYIVQKYIERPLLVFNTKFDIRQWFLISSTAPLTIWMYKDCYIRFSSQLFTLRKLHESVHLTNNSVQSRYKNCRRNAALPECNMWDATQFKKYLASIGHPNIYRDVIYPGMRECITGAILMNQGNLDTRKNCFELYGSDFMLTEDFKPWLIEINSRPALYPSTPITARMCPQVLDDLIKVVIDYPKNPKAPTGRFELLYREKIQKLPKVDPDDLQLKGQKLPTSYFYTPEFLVDDNLQQSSNSSNDHNDCTHRNIKEISSEMKKTLENLLSLIQAERERRKQLKSQCSQVSEQQSEDTQICTNKKCKSEVDIKEDVAEKILTQINNTEHGDSATLEVIKSVATNLNLVESSVSNIVTTNGVQEAATADAPSQHIINVNANEIQEAIKGTSVMQAVSSRGVFQDIINSIRNLSFVYGPRDESTQKT